MLDNSITEADFSKSCYSLHSGNTEPLYDYYRLLRKYGIGFKSLSDVELVICTYCPLCFQERSIHLLVQNNSWFCHCGAQLKYGNDICSLLALLTSRSKSALHVGLQRYKLANK